MTIKELSDSLRDAVRQIAKEKFEIELPALAAEVPPNTALGDLAFPVAFELAKKIKQATGQKANPRAIAETLRSELEKMPNVAKVDVAGAGYLNVFFDRAKFFVDNLGAHPLPTQETAGPTGPKVCVEHTSVNPNKAAHIGHVRNSVLGDTFQRILKATGKRVEVQNYIDNTGVQVADVVVGFMYIEHMDLPAIQALDSQLTSEGRSFDYYCWDLYTNVGIAYQKDEKLKARRADVLHLIEEGGNDTAAVADYVASRNVQCILDTMERLSIRYDLLPRESEILHLHFWNKAFEQMKLRGVIRFETEGNHAGCWVMPFEEHVGTEEHESDKILVRSNGTVTYTGKDIAYQMWKLGILGMDFFYKPFHKYSDGQKVWTTTANSAENVEHHHDFGHGQTVYNVIDSRQSYPQEVVKKGVAAIAPDKGESASVHLSYEMVALSPAAAEVLGFELTPEERRKSFIEMSGRKGIGVKADDLINELIANALGEVESRHPEIAQDDKSTIARQIAVGALRYFLLKFSRNTVIVFDFKEALSFEGETGAFCQYSAVRANSIFRKLSESGESLEVAKRPAENEGRVAEIVNLAENDDIWSLFLAASRLEETVAQAASATEPAILAKYTFNLAKSFNLFYHNHKILAEIDEVKRAVLLCVAEAVKNSLTAALDILGMEVPAKM